MKKFREISDPESCLNRADSDEIVFVLLARDVAAPAAIRAWCAERVLQGQNLPGDWKLCEAMDCADKMKRQRRKGLKRKGK